MSPEPTEKSCSGPREHLPGFRSVLAVCSCVFMIILMKSRVVGGAVLFAVVLSKGGNMHPM